MTTYSESFGDQLRRMRLKQAQHSAQTYRQKRIARRKIVASGTDANACSSIAAAQPGGWHVEPEQHLRPPVDVLVERDRIAALEPRSLTAALLGDPPVGRSALDKRGQSA